MIAGADVLGQHAPMLRGIDPLLGPDLLFVLRAMGHGDEIAVVDANYPASEGAKRLIRAEGTDAVRMVEAILTLLPLDTFVEIAAFRMEVVDDPQALPPVCRALEELIARQAGGHRVGTLERSEFYARARACFAIVATGERRLYGNLILKKGVIPPPEPENEANPHP
jgi:L-fucose mutarotase